MRPKGMFAASYRVVAKSDFRLEKAGAVKRAKAPRLRSAVFTPLRGPRQRWNSKGLDARRVQHPRRVCSPSSVFAGQFALTRKNPWGISGCTGTTKVANPPPPRWVATLVQVTGGTREDVDSNT